eukprot:219967_1
MFGNKHSVTCQGQIKHFANVNHGQYTVVVKRNNNGAYLYLNSDKITILRNGTPGQDNEEDKIQSYQDITRHLQRENTKLLAEKKEQEQVSAAQMNQCVAQIEEQKTLIELMKKEKMVLEKGNNEKGIQMNKLKNKCKSLRDRVRLLEDEKKEFEMNINRLEEENKKLKLLNINTNNYEQWDADEIVHWIISLNPKIYG